MIRNAEKNDIKNIMSIIKAVVPLMQTSGNVQWDSTYPNEERFSKDIENRTLYVYEHNNVIAGVVSLTEDKTPEYKNANWSKDGRTIEIHRLAVLPELRKEKIAQKLMSFAEELAKNKGIEILRGDTNENNKSALRLFQTLGYLNVGTIYLRGYTNTKFFCFEKLI